MKGPILVAIMCFAYSHCMLTGVEEEEKEESFFNKGDVRGYITQGGKDQMVVMPGIPPTTGIKEFTKILTWLKTKGFHRYNTTIIKEMDLGDFYMLLSSHIVYDTDESIRDKGTFFKFYKRAKGKLTMVANGVVSTSTAWPVKNARLGEYQYRITANAIGLKGYS